LHRRLHFTDLHQIWRNVWVAYRNVLAIVWGVSILYGSNFVLFHWQSQSPSTSGWCYYTARGELRKVPIEHVEVWCLCLHLCCSWITGFIMRSHTKFSLLDHHTPRLIWTWRITDIGVVTTVIWRWAYASGTFSHLYTHTYSHLGPLHGTPGGWWLCLSPVYHLCCSTLCCRLSVTSWCSINMTKHRIMQTTLFESVGTLVFWCHRSRRNSNGVISIEHAK